MFYNEKKCHIVAFVLFFIYSPGFSTDEYIVCLQCRNCYTHTTQYSPPGGQTHTRKLSRAQFNILAICTHGLLNNLLFLYDFIVAQVQLRKHKTTRKSLIQKSMLNFQKSETLVKISMPSRSLISIVLEINSSKHDTTNNLAWNSFKGNGEMYQNNFDKIFNPEKKLFWLSFYMS